MNIDFLKKIESPEYWRDFLTVPIIELEAFAGVLASCKAERERFLLVVGGVQPSEAQHEKRRLKLAIEVMFAIGDAIEARTLDTIGGSIDTLESFRNFCREVNIFRVLQIKTETPAAALILEDFYADVATHIRKIDLRVRPNDAAKAILGLCRNNLLCPALVEALATNDAQTQSQRQKKTNAAKHYALAIATYEYSNLSDTDKKGAHGLMLQVGVLSLKGNGLGEIANRLGYKSPTWTGPRRKKFIDYMIDSHGIDVSTHMPSVPKKKDT